MIGVIISIIGWLAEMPVWLFIVIIVVIEILNIIVRLNNSDRSNNYDNSDYSDDDSGYTYESEYQPEQNKVDQPFVFYDYSALVNKNWTREAEKLE